MTKGLFNRYDDGSVTVFVCIASIVTSVLALITLSLNWVKLTLGFGINIELGLRGFSQTASGVADITKYFSSDVTSILSILSLVATASYWIMLIGAIVMIICAVVILITPRAEALAIISRVIICVFAIIGLLFTIPFIMSDKLGFIAAPLIMLIVAGIFAVIIHFWLMATRRQLN